VRRIPSMQSSTSKEATCFGECQKFKDKKVEVKSKIVCVAPIVVISIPLTTRSCFWLKAVEPAM